MYIYINKLNEENGKFSIKPLGVIAEKEKICFRLFAPSATSVKLYFFNSPQESFFFNIEMNKADDGVWEVCLQEKNIGRYYAFKIAENSETDFNNLPYCIDPYAKAVTSYTDYFNPRRSIIIKDNYNWENDTWIKRDCRDLIIYEMHIRDMTAHPSANAKHPGTYMGLIEKGIEYIKDLGVNTVELLPAQEFGNVESPFNKEMYGVLNTWNPYERNHWGYMTAAFFAPSSYYSENWNEFKMHKWMGSDGRQIKEFKDMVKSFHRAGIGVIMDVVFNHLSEYELGNLKQTDKKYYFRYTQSGELANESFCGNDLKTEAPMVRRLIIESIVYWMTEYHIDGFRFDLGKLIDWETLEEIIAEARKINPDVVLIAEPWGGGYDPHGFSRRDWSSWNDRIRNGIKGENPIDGLGWIFGNWYGDNSKEHIKNYIKGTTTEFEHGLFLKPEHSVNYLEAHDGYTLGDFIRIAAGKITPHQKINDLDINIKLSENELKLNKLAALFLFVSQGITMIHAGQEFARSKVIETNNNIPDNAKGEVDYNSYNKDNTTNYINYNHVKLNTNLFNYYKGLIELRKTYKEFRRASTEEISFMENLQNKFTLGFRIKKEYDFIVILNAEAEKEEEITIPEGKWEIVVNDTHAGASVISTVSGIIKIPPRTGLVLRRSINQH